MVITEQQTRLKETYVNKSFNAAALNAGVTLAIADLKTAKRGDNLPHNAFVITNQDTSCVLYIFLDDFSDPDNPDYVLQANQVISVGIDDGVSFSTLFLKNTHGSSNIAAKAIKYRISTLKESTYQEE